MCIVIISTAHPDYPLVLLSNRDEFLNRPTARANWWDAPHQHVLGGRDFERKEQGTWLGITKQGHLAALTNFREEGSEKHRDKSRGGIINAFLTAPPHQRETPKEFARRLIDEVGVHDCGGFSLMFGELGGLKDGSFPGLSILSNRSASADDLTTIATGPGETHGLSNSHYGDRSWPKVVNGEEFVKQAIADDVASRNNGNTNDAQQDDFIASLLDILSINELPPRPEGQDWETYVLQMRKSIFIPPVHGPEDIDAPALASAQDRLSNVSHMLSTRPNTPAVQVSSGGYGTQRQTVLLVDQKGHVVFTERTLYGDGEKKVEGSEGISRFEFDIESWWRHEAISDVC